MISTLPPESIDRIIEMAWEDRTPFEAIEFQFGLKENEVRVLMRQEMKPSSFRMWRERVTGRKTKHAAKRPENMTRFKSKNQKG
ncbi:MAG: TIGR03643 family protein [Schleiferiaceae bacterium]|nr:TIGR03643 family protein [Schleiferiaceae bacterium]